MNTVLAISNAKSIVAQSNLMLHTNKYITIRRLLFPEMQRIALGHTASVFFDPVTAKQFVEKNTTFLNTKEYPELHRLNKERKLCEVYGAFDRKGHIFGSFIMYYYLWPVFSKQKFFLLQKNRQGQLISINDIGTKIKKLFNVDGARFVADLGYVAVSPEHRHQGIAGKLFHAAYSDAIKFTQPEPSVILSMILGKYSRDPVKINLMERMINKGLIGDNAYIPLKFVSTYYDQPEDIFDTNPSALATRLLTKQYNFKKIGFSRFLGETWVNVVS